MESLVPNNKNETGASSPTQKPARVIRTMKDDVKDAIERQHETSVTIAMAEERKKTPTSPVVVEAQTIKKEEETPRAPRPIGRIIVVIAIFLVIALLGVAYVFLLPKIKAINFKFPSISIHLPSFGKQATTTPSETTTVAQPLAPSIIHADLEKRIDVINKTPKQVLTDVITETKQGVASGFIKNIYFFETTASSTSGISANRLFSSINISVPEILARSLDSSFMVGLRGDAGNKATPFIILKINEHSAGLAGMLAWEMGLPGFFDDIFGTTIKDNVTPISKFRNIVAGGKDIRTLNLKSEGTISYAFADENTIVIAGSQSALENVLSLAAKK